MLSTTFRLLSSISESDFAKYIDRQKPLFKLILAAAGGTLPIRYMDKMTDAQREYLTNKVKIMFGSCVSLVHDDKNGYNELTKKELDELFADVND
mgnify:CR=1 FL=1